MALMSLREVSLAYGAAPLLDEVTFHVEERERICLLGRNGAGKSTLMRVLAGQAIPDKGIVERQTGVRVGMLEQDVPEGREATVAALVAEGVPEADRGPEGTRMVEATLSRMELDGEAGFAPLSAGNKRRVLLARALVSKPDVLLLDEPTNHLDIPSIEWMEGYFSRYEGTVLFVSHDRAFVRKLATRVVELERGQIFSFPGSYEKFVERKEQALDAESKADAHLDKKLAEEEAWIRRGIKARGVRNMGRVRALEKLRAQRKARRERVGQAKMAIAEADRSGSLVLEAKGVEAGYGDTTVVRDFDTIVLRSDRVGIVGPNGCGKSTLLRTMLGQHEPSAGSVRLGSKVEVAYFDQLRGQIDPDATVAQNVGEGSDWVMLGDRRKHVIGYLDDFLFTADRAKSPAGSLSGGERNRLLLAKLFLKPSNLMVLDEPTNDLDVETLELLEERLNLYGGTVLVVSHDRDFVDNVATSTIAYAGDGRFVEHAGGYSDWLSAERAPDLVAEATSESMAPEAKAQKAKSPKKPKTQGPRKLSFKETRELEALPATIETLEAEQAQLHEKMADPSFYQESGDEVAGVTTRLEALEKELEAAYARWQDLEAIAEASS